MGFFVSKKKESKYPAIAVPVCFGGKCKIRTCGTVSFNGLANRRIKPLYQLAV